MLKWIQDEYEAEVVALTVNLGQPGEDYDVVEGKALQLGAVAAEVVDAREEFAHDFVVPAIKANAIYGLDYPLFTALGRPLIAKLAVEYAREHGCDTIAHGCTGKGNDQVRIEATVATLAPELKVIAPVRGWQMGRDEEIAYAREHGIPIKGGAEHTPYSIDDNLWGRSSEGRWIEDLDHAPEDDVFQLVTRPEEAPDEPEVVERRGSSAGVPVALNGERLGLVELLERAAEIGCRHGVGIVDHIEDRIVGLKVRDIYEVPAAAIILAGPRRARAARRHDPPEPVQGRARPQVGLPRLRRAVVGAAARRDLDAYMDAVNEQVTGTIGMKLYKGTARVVTRESPNAVYDAALATFETSRRPVQPAGVAGLHRAVVAAVAHGPPLARARRGVRPARCSTKHWDSPSGRAPSGTWAQAAFARLGQAALAQADGGRARRRGGDVHRRWGQARPRRLVSRLS